jgi:nitronate monooxygenase/enoyl-[acyl-carrier protein] reductase II
VAVIRTPLCDLLGIDHPIIQAGMGTVPSAALVAAVSNAGALGTFSTFTRPAEDTQRQLAVLSDLTSRPFAVNHVVQAVDDETFALGLEAQPKVVSMALADPGEYVARSHDAGALFMQQVTTVAQAEEAAERGVDIIVAQGGESGGFGGTVATMVLVPQVVDAVRPLPVVAAGGTYDGRGLAAALMLGAVGVNIGTRFLASAESNAHDDYKTAVADAVSEDAVKAEFFNEFIPVGDTGYGTSLRSLRTPFVDRWAADRERAHREADRIGREFGKAAGENRSHELLAAAGQTSGAISEVLPAAEIVRLLVEQAETALNRTPEPS